MRHRRFGEDGSFGGDFDSGVEELDKSWSGKVEDGSDNDCWVGEGATSEVNEEEGASSGEGGLSCEIIGVTIGVSLDEDETGEGRRDEAWECEDSGVDT